MDTNDLDTTFPMIRGNDPRKNTNFNIDTNHSVRGKLQTRRCKLNKEINKELRLRAGAENLFKATDNPKVKNRISLELSFVNSNLQLLKEKLTELNSSVEVYQNNSHDSIMPFIPLGLKETVEIDFLEAFSHRIKNHYHEDPLLYVDAIHDISNTRQAARTPTRDLQGVNLLFRYYNLLYYVERRFFPYERNGVYFEWYDSLTGVPSCQRTVAFEKSCILFNLAGVYTQIAAKQDRKSEKGLDTAVDSFLRAAGIFKHIHETFTNAPSIDLKSEFLEVLVALMLAQARECLYEKLLLQIEAFPMSDTYHIHRDLSGEAAQLMTEYSQINVGIDKEWLLACIPECWTAFVTLKAEYYKALAHYHASVSIDLSKPMATNDLEQEKYTINCFLDDDSTNNNDICPRSLKKAHIKESLQCHEESQRLQRMCRDLKNKTSLTKILQEAHLKALVESECIDEDMEKSMLIDNENFDMIEPKVDASSKFILSITDPDFTTYKTEDPFKKLGPLAIFSARRKWSAPQSVCLKKGTYECHTEPIRSFNDTQLNGRSSYSADSGDVSSSGGQRTVKSSRNDYADYYGFKIRNDAPVVISYVRPNSLAELGGLKESDFIVEVAGVDVKWYTERQVNKMIRGNTSYLELKVVTPLIMAVASTNIASAATPINLDVSLNNATISSRSSESHSDRGTKKKMGDHRFSSWNLFRRSQSLGKLF